jgi:hypothetical protein
MLKYLTFVTLLSCERLYKAFLTLLLNTIIAVAISVIISIATSSFSYSCCTSLTTLSGRDNLCL